MTTAPLGRAVRDLRRLAQAPDGGELSDRELLARFAGRRDEAAFAVLVRRHGPTVLATCRRVLRHRQDAEDACQAAFLVLARKAGSLRWRDSAAAWLYRVAYHLALKMRAAAGRRRTRPLPDVAGPDPGAGQSDPELRAILDEELGRLPEKYQAALLLCLWAGKTRAEAARELGWKEGTVKIRLERGRALLRSRLARRGLAGVAVAAVLAGAAAPAALSATLVGATVDAARWFACGETAAAAARPVALANEVHKTMTLIRLKNAALLAVAVAVASLGVGFLAHQAFAGRPGVGDPSPPEAARQARPQPPAARAPAPAPVPVKPVRVLLFSGGPTREYQYLCRLFAKQAEEKQAELTVHLQSATPQAVQAVPADRLLENFPTRLTTDGKKGDVKDTSADLAEYDVIVAIDPDWSRLTAEQCQLLGQWVGQPGRGLILVAGPVHTLELARKADANKLQPIIDVLPVRVRDSRVDEGRDATTPCRLSFPRSEKFIEWDEGGKDPLGGWSRFFFGERRNDWQKTDDAPTRGFYTVYPVDEVKKDATVVATFHDPRAPEKARDVPYLVVMPSGKGRSVFLGSGETWRLRELDEEFHERFWTRLVRYAASAEPAPDRKGSRRSPELTPQERKAIDKGLTWLIHNQLRDGHWDGAKGKDRVGLTALAGTALLMQGSTINEGWYADNIRHAADWLVVRSQRDGRIGNPGNRAEAVESLEEHGRALAFLAAVYGEEEDADRRRKLCDVLTRAVEFTVAAQTSGGGWGHRFRGSDKDDDGQADVAATVVLLRGMRAARAAGIVVPREVLERARAYLEKEGDGSAAAAADALAAGEAGTPAARKWLESARKSAPPLDPKAKPGADDDVNLFSFALATFWLGDEGHARLLPESKPQERLTWTRFRKEAFDYLLKTQNEDGSWGDEPGKVRATALSLAVLQLDAGVLPLYNPR
jgi:RNA polymerase sigma factor (sigma-70 family)